MPISRIHATAVAYHRNGIEGEPFHVVLFTHGSARMLAIVYAARGCVSVLDCDLVTRGHIGGVASDDSSRNSWRGDEFESGLRLAITQHDEAADHVRRRAQRLALVPTV
jgi:hypothetical protein